MSNQDPEEVIENFLEGNPRAEEFRRLAKTLVDRLRDLRERRRLEPDALVRDRMDGQIAQLDKQIAALRVEEAVTRFVEDSVRATLARPRVRSDEDDEPDAEDG